jgi:hypothetical protein
MMSFMNVSKESKKEGGATEKFGTKRKAEVDRKRKEDQNN